MVARDAVVLVLPGQRVLGQKGRGRDRSSAPTSDGLWRTSWADAAPERMATTMATIDRISVTPDRRQTCGSTTQDRRRLDRFSLSTAIGNCQRISGRGATRSRSCRAGLLAAGELDPAATIGRPRSSGVVSSRLVVAGERVLREGPHRHQGREIDPRVHSFTAGRRRRRAGRASPASPSTPSPARACSTPRITGPLAPRPRADGDRSGTGIRDSRAFIPS